MLTFSDNKKFRLIFSILICQLISSFDFLPPITSLVLATNLFEINLNFKLKLELAIVKCSFLLPFRLQKALGKKQLRLAAIQCRIDYKRQFSKSVT